MKSHLLLFPTHGMSRAEWLAFRQRGLGASEVGAILGLDEFKSSLELYYLKIGERPQLDVPNMAKFMGTQTEDLNAQMWSYWDGSEESMLANFEAERVVRKCRRVNAFVVNPAYPWLFASLDRVINKHNGRGEGTLELKTISGFEADKWTGGLPPKYVTQVNDQMGIFEFEYGEMSLLRDGRRLDVLPFEFRPGIFEAIVTKTKIFWDRVLEARKAVNEKYLAIQSFNQRRVDECNALIDALAPEPDGSLAYEKYLRVRHNQGGGGERMGTPLELLAAQEHRRIGEELVKLEEDYRRQESVLKTALGDLEVLNFGPDGKVTWKKTEAGYRIFKNKIRD